MGLYEEMKRVDVLTPIQELMNRGEIWLDKSDWKLKTKVTMLSGKPWYMTKYATDRDCLTWTFYFNTYGFVPKGCRECWKVACKLGTLKELVKMVGVQERMVDEEGGGACKCGYEDESRWYARKGGLYSAFWYAKLGSGLSGGLRLKEWVKDRLEGVFPSSVKVGLKRGCTEMEMAFPDSERWDEYAEKGGWDAKEALLDSIFDFDGKQYLVEGRQEWERKLVKPGLLVRWVNFAIANNDPTYREFREDDPMPGIRKYNKED